MMVSVLGVTGLGTLIYLLTEVTVIFGGAMFFTWLVVLCVRKLIAKPPKGKRHSDTKAKSPNLVDLRLQVESTRLETERLRLEQERLRAEREAGKKGD